MPVIIYNGKTAHMRITRLVSNVQDEPRPWLARAVLLGARIVTAMVVGSGALLALFRERDFNAKLVTEK